MKPLACIWCRSTGLRRLTRRSFISRYVFPLFGYYPWECMSCRRKCYLRSDGHADGMTGV